MPDLVKYPYYGKCQHQNIYDNPTHAYCSAPRQKDIMCIHYMEETQCPHYKKPEEAQND